MSCSKHRARPCTRSQRFASSSTGQISAGSSSAHRARGLQLGVRSQSRTRVLSDSELVKAYRAAEEIGYPYGNIVQLLAAHGHNAAVRSQACVGPTSTRRSDWSRCRASS